MLGNDMWGHDEAMDRAWPLLKEFGYQGQRGDQENIMPLARQTMDRYDKWSAGAGEKPSWTTPSSRASKKPMKQMELAGMPEGKYSSQQPA